MKERDIQKAFQEHFNAWKTHNPQAEEYLPFDLMDFFRGGVEAVKEMIWHQPEEIPESGKTIVAVDAEDGECHISYGGGMIEKGHWAYAEDLFCYDMMDQVTEKEQELEAWMHHDFVERERERIRRLELQDA
jgi:hypothetical protein